ncbi:MAG: VWA domain-containing protein [Candidatus Omnitrophica bacterium]|nr:VWA domain-containing protein [Candidatus Omnitrophota bacterium]
MIFKDPFILILVPAVLVLLFWTALRLRSASLRFPSGNLVGSLHRTWKIRFFWAPAFLRYLAVILFIIALSGPRSVLEEAKHEIEGIDIVLAIDGSGSMAAEDFTLKGQRYNRLEVIKSVVGEFIDARKSDRIGLVAFAGLAYTVSPLTTDYSWLKTNLERLQLNMMEDGTAIGSGISASLSRLQKSEAKSKVIILLTDGVNNRGKVDPVAAAKAAKVMGVKVYTIGAGTNGMAPYPVQDIWGRHGYQNVPVEIDEETLRTIADTTGGRYFRATDTDSLRDVYNEIDRLEKTKIEETGYREYKELFVYFLGAALILLLLAVALESTVFLRLP